jgi:Gas vesicle synthesis protein GvpL/GvpF
MNERRRIERVTEEAATAASIYLYGFVRAVQPLVISEGGVTGQVDKIRLNDVTALVGPVGDPNLQGDRRSLMAHSRVLDEAMAAGPVLPMQFGVVLPDERTLLTDVLEGCRVEIDELFQRVEGKVELNVKALGVEDVAIKELLEEDERIRMLHDGLQGLPEDATYFKRIELGQAVAAGLDRKKAEWSALIIDRMKPLAADYTVTETRGPTIVLNASFLVDRGAIDGFEQSLTAVAQDLGERVHVKLTGPLAPYSFVSMRLPVKTA